MKYTTTLPDNLYTVFPNEYYMDIMLYQHGFERCKAGHAFGPAVRSHYLFHYVFEGSGTLYTTSRDGITREFHIKKDQGFLICPKQITTYIADKETPWEYAWVEFDGSKAKEWLTQAGLNQDNPVYSCTSREITSFLREELIDLITKETASSIFQIGQFYRYMDQLIHGSQRYNTSSAVKQKDYYIRQAVSYIEQNFSEEITIEEIADFCCLNRSYLGKIFKDSLNKTPQQYLIYYRMKQATQFLKYTSMSVGEIGKAVGYPNQLHFSRAFKNVYHIPPSEWRKEHGI